MIELYSQGHAITDYLTSARRESCIETAIKYCKKFGLTADQTAQDISQEFNMPLD